MQLIEWNHEKFGTLLALVPGVLALFLTIASMAGWVQAYPFNQERAGAPTIVSYRGISGMEIHPMMARVILNFPLWDTTGSTQYWSNDNNSPPASPVTLLVNQGLFNILLGDTTLSGMVQALSADVFTNPNTRLRVWFSPDNSTWNQMPDQVVAAVPYALQAQDAANADHAAIADSATNATNADNATNATKLTQPMQLMPPMP